MRGSGKRWYIPVTVVLGLSSMAFALTAKRQELRDLLSKQPHSLDAVNQYREQAESTPDPTLAAEYALVLAANRLTEAALAEMDRAFILDPTDDFVRFAGSTLLAHLGVAKAAAEIGRPAPAWFSPRPDFIPVMKTRADALELGDFTDEMLAVNALMNEARFVTAAERMARVSAKFPKEPMAWAGYSIALEKIGAYHAAADALGTELALNDKTLDSDARAALVEHQAELKTHEPLTRKKPNEVLKGAYTAFAGGGITHVSGATTYNFNVQAGKFLTNQLNVGFGTGYASPGGLDLGLSGRWHQPLPVDAPMNVTAGTRINYFSSPSSFGLILSPGLSYFLKDSSIDLFIDVGVFGPQQGVVTTSVGYTMYFRGAGT